MRKFSQEEILEIRSKRAAGQTQPALALEYSCSVNTIRSIEKGLSYRDAGGFAEATDSQLTSSEARLRALIQEQEPVTQQRDPLLEMLASAEPLEVSLSRLRAECAERSAELKKGLDSLKPQSEEQDTDELSN